MPTHAGASTQAISGLFALQSSGAAVRIDISGATQSARNLHHVQSSVSESDDFPRLGIGRAGVHAWESGARCRPWAMILGSCELPHEIWYPPHAPCLCPPPPRSLPPLPYASAQSRTNCVLRPRPVPAQRAPSFPRGPPPPMATPPILLANLPEAKRGNTTN